MTDLDAAELDLLSGDTSGLPPDDQLDESVLDRITPPLESSFDDHHDNGIVKEELTEIDLYDDAIAPSGVERVDSNGGPAPLPSTPRSSTSNVNVNTSLSISKLNNLSYSSDGKKFCCYVGNMTWWTTEADLMAHIQSIGVNDLVDIKFFENRLNGQSKGYALLIFSSDSAVRQVTEKLPERVIHGQNLAVLPYTKASLARFEEATAKTQTRPDQKAVKKEDNCLNMGTIRIGGGGPGGPMGPGPGGPMGPGPAPLMMLRPGGPGPMGGGPPMMRAGGPPMGGMGPGPMGPGPMQGGPPNIMNRVGPGPPMPLMMNTGPSMQQAPPMNPMMAARPGGPPQMGMPPQQPPMIQQVGPPGAPRPLMSAPAPQPLMQQGPPPNIMQQQRPPMTFQTGPPGTGGPPGTAPPLMSIQPGLRPPGMPQQQMMGAPPGQQMHPGHPGQHHSHPQPGMQHQQLPPPGAHLNPQVFPGMQNMQGGHLSETEFEEIMNRNRTVSSSAISRAVADASSGDTKGAIETLLTAISLIKASRVAHDDRCRLLVAGLQDTLYGIDSKGNKKNRDRSRSRSRSRERDRKRRRRSRSRTRSRSRSPRHSRHRY